jgi:fatty acid desaturase
MATDPGDGPDRAANAGNAQRTAERSALRKVRKALDRIEADRARERRWLRNTLIACAMLLGFGALMMWGIFSGGPPRQDGPAVHMPAPKQ